MDAIDSLSKDAGDRRWIGETDEDTTDNAKAILSAMVGALVLSRAINNKHLSKRFLRAAAKRC